MKPHFLFIEGMLARIGSSQQILAVISMNRPVVIQDSFFSHIQYTVTIRLFTLCSINWHIFTYLALLSLPLSAETWLGDVMLAAMISLAWMVPASHAQLTHQPQWNWTGAISQLSMLGSTRPECIQAQRINVSLKISLAQKSTFWK